MTAITIVLMLVCLGLVVLWQCSSRCSRQRGLRLALLATELRRSEQSERSQQQAAREFKETIAEQAEQIEELEQSLSQWRQRHAAEAQHRQALLAGRTTHEQED
jgi:sensor histidine kinase YesM